MDAARFIDFLRSLTATTSRRGWLSGLAVGLLAALPFVRGASEAAGKKKHKRKKKKKKTVSPPPLSPPPSPPPPPPPTTKADASCPGPGNSTFSTIGSNRFAQTFTALASGQLVSAQAVLEKDPNSIGAFIMHLVTVDAAGVPTNTVLDTATVANSQVPNGLSTVTFSFPSPATVAAGSQYALVVTRPGANFVRWRGHGSDVCAGAGFTCPNDSGQFAISDPPRDFLFTTFVNS
jgi:hypothetical protein